ncbi:hypothetical protein B0T16DRAFT_388768 [Cercophora newfieldiana]|uniref:Heterokaryon incompatibility domain-containing protein n=1 Tax=Cercophora newfieldiana TaxID=92897 RepID=A0AA39Y9K2_9PEZI|nr:hypothetical protein B0T16DRAFT_388768 [Cercophora newfieldiana]
MAPRNKSPSISNLQKSHQVAQMCRVYSTASSVIVWLGPDRDDAHLIADFIAAVRDGVGPPYFPRRGRRRRIPSRGRRHSSCGGSGGEGCGVVGRRRVEKEVGEGGTVPVQETRLQGDKTESQNGNENSGHDTPVSGDTDDEETDDDSEEVAYDVSALGQIQNWTLLSLLESFSQRKCTLPEDQVYGLLGIADDAHQYGAPSYSKSAEEVFTDVALRGLERKDKGLSFLCFAGAGDHRNSKRLQLPSVTPIDVTAEGSHLSPDRFFANGEPLLYRTGTTRLQAVLQTLVYNIHIAFNKTLIPGSKSFSSIATGFLYSLGQGLGEEIREEGEDVERETPDYITSFLRWLGQDRRGRLDDEIRELFMGKRDSGPQTRWRTTKDELTRGEENYRILYSPSRMFINP